MAFSLLGTLNSPVRAATINVNTELDFDDNDSTCSLREAIQATNTNAPIGGCPAGDGEPVVDVINVPAGTYLLDYSGEVGGLDGITESVAIIGAGAATTIIDGVEEDRVFDLVDGDVAISNVTITGGVAEDADGGGIRVGSDATLALSGSILIDNHANDAGSGGGIAIADGASATVSGSIIGSVASPNTTQEDGGGIYVGEGATLTLTASTVTGNTAEEDGGGIYIDESVLDDQDVVVVATIVTISGSSTVSGNSAGSDGGGIFVNDDATATITSSTISGNAAGVEGVGDGGGISADGTANLNGSTVTENDADQGGGIYIDSQGTVNVNDGSTVSENTADEGGGIANEGSDTLNLTGSTVSGNDADGDGGGIWTRYDATTNIVDSTIAGNTAGDGGGIYNDFLLFPGAMTITRSTIRGNSAESEGGGIWHENSSQASPLTITNSTVSGNTAGIDGGGLFIDGDLELAFSTVTLNTAESLESGGGIFHHFGLVEFYASIMASNTPDDCFSFEAQFISYGSNIDSDDSCRLESDGDQPDTDPKLGALASNAPGTTQTHALQFDSPAVDAVEPASLPELGQADFVLAGLPQLPTCSTAAPTDQRGIARPQDGDSDGVAVCDIGAYELLPPTVSINDVTVVEGDSGTVDAVFTVTLSRPSTGTVTVAFATANGTATVVADYQAATGTVTFAPGDTSETLTVRVVGDTVDEPNETFFVNLTAPVGATLADAQGTGNILDDEGPIVTLAPTPTQAARQGTLGSTSLPDTGTPAGGLEDWGAPGVAIGLVLLSLTVLIWNRRRHVRAR